MRNNAIFKSLAALALVLAAAPQAVAQAPEPPIYDVHFHAMPFMTPDGLRARMDRFNIQRQGGGGASGSPERPAPPREREFKTALQERYIPAVGPSVMVVMQREGGIEAFANTTNPAAAKALQQIEAMLRDLGARVLGEIHVNSASFAPAPVRRKLPVDGPFVRALWALAAKYDVPLMIHVELDADSAQQLERLMASSDPKVRLILAHCGSFTLAAQIRPFLEKFPNFVCDLSYRSPPQVKGLRVAERAIFDAGGIKSDWRALIEAFPDRFAVGIDDVHDWAEYDAVATIIRRGLLERLTPETARKVAFANAKAWLKL